MSSASQRATLLPGARFGSYEIVGPLGAGGMGQVYRARDVRLGREVAIKTVLLQQAADGEALRRFEQEARSASSLNHPNIVTVYELGDVDGTRYIAMELLGGETVRKLLASGPMPLPQTVDIAAQVADALAKAHEAGVVHRDLKPENVIVSGAVAKIVDFGLAKLFTGDTEAGSSTTLAGFTQPGAVLGTIGYMSPEQAAGQSVDFRADQFSFGSMLYEMVTGRPAFSGKTHAETLASILRDQPPSLGMRSPVPAPLIWIVERCLAKKPDQRYASTRDLARDLAAVRKHLGDAPAPAAAAARPGNNLPVQRTAFVGRETEAASLRALLFREGVRLITLTGPGGIGKTRLALHVAGELSERFPGGLVFVALSGIGDAGLLSSAIAQAAGIRDTGGQSPHEALQEYLRSLPGPMLLLLDNFEHLLAAAPVIAELLSLNRLLKVVVTSQAALRVYGEQEFPVPPLAVPDPASLPALQQLAALPAIALFVERAQAVKRDFALSKENAAAVAAICARLDGLPLALELAAARVKLLSPAAMQARLESCLNLLTGGARDLPMRQQTLRGTIDWSYGLLNAGEQTLFRRLSVFVGGCTLEGVEAVCDTQGDLGLDVLDGMSSMVDKSLVQQVEDAEGARFLMLRTIREYALERLNASGDEAATRQAHAAYGIVLAEEGADHDVVQDEWLRRMDTEHDNLRAALDWLIENGKVEWGLRLGTALFRFWETREHLAEGRDRLTRLLQSPAAAGAPSKLRSRALFAAGVLADCQGDYVPARQFMEGSLAISRERDDKHGIAVALNALGVNARDRGQAKLAASLFEESLAVWRDIGDPVAIARAFSNLANVTKLQGDFARAQQLYDECLTIFRKIKDGEGIAWSLNYKGDVARERGDFASARLLYEESLAAFRLLGNGWGIASSLCDLGDLSRCEQLYPDAHRMYAESVRIFHDLGHRRGMARVLESLAASFAAQDKAEDALVSAGAAAALRQRVGAPLTATEQAKMDQILESARKQLGTEEGTAAWMRGWNMPPERVIEPAPSTNVGSS